MNRLETIVFDVLERHVCDAVNALCLTASRNEKLFAESPEKVEHLGASLRVAKGELIEVRKIITALKDNNNDPS